MSPASPGAALAGLLVFLSTALGAGAAAAEDRTRNAGLRYSLNTGSYVHHAYASDQHFTQRFHNYLLAVERRLDGAPVDHVLAGTLINSFGHRCVLFGVDKTWATVTDRLSFEGVYAYSGEFLFGVFHDCGDQGAYRHVRRYTGVGFSPFLYHGLEYDLEAHASLEAGFIPPGILVLSVQWHF